MRVSNKQFRILIQTMVLIFSLGCGFGTSYWPPAVTSKADIEKLPTSQRDIRGIGIGDQDLQLIADRFPNLDYLFLNSNSSVSDQGITRLSKLSKLHQVVIEDGSHLSDQSVVVLAELPSLHQLIITNSPQLTDASLSVLGNKKQLKILYMFKCPSLTNRGKSELKNALPKCEILFQ